MYDHIFYKQVQISRSDIRPHIKWAVSLVILHMVTSIFLQGLCGYIWVNILTLSPRRGRTKGEVAFSRNLAFLQYFLQYFCNFWNSVASKMADQTSCLDQECTCKTCMMLTELKLLDLVSASCHNECIMIHFKTSSFRKLARTLQSNWA